jgi:hypothetical protein
MYETRAFHTDPADQRYHDIDCTREITFISPWSIKQIDADDLANQMHETVVSEIIKRLENGEQFDADRD